MQAQITSLYFQAFQLANNRERRAEPDYRCDRGGKPSSHARFGAWDDLHRGQPAGEALRLQLRR